MEFDEEKQAYLKSMYSKPTPELTSAHIENVVKNIAPTIFDGIETKNYKLSVKNPRVITLHDNDDVEQQKKVKNKLGMWSSDLRADIELVDKHTGEVVDKHNNLKIAEIPRMTDRMSYLVGGNEFQFTKQFRLKPGIYTKHQSNGEVSSFFNTDKTIDFNRGYNQAFKISLNPEKKIFKMEYGSKNFPLYTSMRAMGVSDKQMDTMWGEGVAEENRKAYSKRYGKDLAHMYESVTRQSSKGVDTVRMESEIKERFEKMGLDGDVTTITLGKRYESATPEAILAASKKVIDVNAGRVKDDDRESLVFKSIYDVDTHVRESLIKNADTIRKNVGYKLDKTKKISQSISSKTLKTQIEGVITSSTLSNPPNQQNVLSMIGDANKVTVMGDGGIGSSNTVTDDMRLLSNTEIGFIDPMHTPESGSIGIQNHLTATTAKIGDEIYSIFKDTKSGKVALLSPKDVYNEKVAFPDQYDEKGSPKKSKVTVIHKGEIKDVDPKEVSLKYGTKSALFDPAVNNIPFVNSLQGNRGLTAAKMQEQAVSLKYREAPLYDIKSAGGVSMSSILGKAIGVQKAKTDGEVISVSKNEIIVKGKDGEKSHKLYNNFSLNSESLLSNDPIVKKGDVVKEGQVLTDSNYTKGGRLALGANLSVAFTPYMGYNFEDSAVMSESAAKKLSSEHMYDFRARRTSEGVFSRDKLKAYYPEETSGKKLDKLDSNGIIKVGEEVDEGDILIAHLEKSNPTADDIAIGKLSKQLRRDMSNKSQVWSNGHKGIVTGVETHGNNVVVNIKTLEPLKEADKVAGLHGNKHIISKIVPDEMMPLNPRTGKRVDLTMSPIGVSNRINTSQTLENAVGKIAEETGKIYDIENFSGEDNSKKVLEDLKKAGISHKEQLFNPYTGKNFKRDIAVGVSHIIKLEHKIDHKFAARSYGAYDLNEQPVSGGHDGGKNLARMETAALLSRGSDETLREMFNIKGQRNDEYWRSIEKGELPGPIKKSNAWNKFETMLAGSGIRVNKTGKVYTLKPITDKDIAELSNGELSKPTETYRIKDMGSINGGLFDNAKTGGVKGEKYTHFSLPEKVLSPVMAKSTSYLVGLSQKVLEDIAGGDLAINVKTRETGPVGTAGMVSGSEAVEKMINGIDIKKLRSESEETLATSKNHTNINKANKTIKFLNGIEKTGVKPEEFMVTKVLVTPPKFRPVTSMPGSGMIMIADENELYQQVANTAKAYSDLKKNINDLEGIPDDIKSVQMAPVSGQLYKDMKALTGFGDPTSYLGKRSGVKGFAMQIDAGDKQTKHGFFQSKVLNRRQDLTGRSTVTLNPYLSSDEAGIPEEMANEIFKPFIIKKIVGLGYSPLEARKHMKDNTETFIKARKMVADERVVLINRAPTLHKYNFTGARAVLTKGKSVEIPGNVIVDNYGGDYDGDAVQVHVPISAKAQAEAVASLPSRNMIKSGYSDTVLNKPSLDAIAGLYMATHDDFGSKKGVKFDNIEDARKAVKKGDIDYSDIAIIKGRKATLAHHELNSDLPEDSQRWGNVVNKSEVSKWILDVVKKSGGEDGLKLADKLRDIGNHTTNIYGITLGVEDIGSFADVKKAVEDQTKSNMKNRHMKYEEAFATALNSVNNKELLEKYDNTTDPGIVLKSGAGKGIDNFSQIVNMPGVMQTGTLRGPYGSPVKTSYSEGLDLTGYITAAHSARGGNIMKSVSSAKPGYFTKSATSSLYDTRIKSEEFVDGVGIEYDISDNKGIRNRYSARDVKDLNGKVVLKKNDLITDKDIASLKKHGVKSIFVQSPLTDPTSGDGFSGKSFGVDEESGADKKFGDHIGIQSGHTITESALNMSMKAFHTGGVYRGADRAKEGLRGGFDAMNTLMRFGKDGAYKATVSDASGIVRKVDKSDIGGWDITVRDGEKEHKMYAKESVDPMIKAGDKIKKGDVITTGIASPFEYLEQNGMKKTQRYMVDELFKLNGGAVDKRNLETIVRGVTNTTKILDSGLSKKYVTGDIANLTEVEHLNRTEHAGIKHQPMLVATGITNKGSAVSKDWINRLGSSRLKDVLYEGSAQGWESDTGDKTISPIGALVTGEY